jgi:hypothetical protein
MSGVCARDMGNSIAEGKSSYPVDFDDIWDKPMQTSSRWIHVDTALLFPGKQPSLFKLRTSVKHGERFSSGPHFGEHVSSAAPWVMWTATVRSDHLYAVIVIEAAAICIEVVKTKEPDYTVQFSRYRWRHDDVCRDQLDSYVRDGVDVLYLAGEKAERRFVLSSRGEQQEHGVGIHADHVPPWIELSRAIDEKTSRARIVPVAFPASAKNVSSVAKTA